MSGYKCCTAIAALLVAACAAKAPDTPPESGTAVEARDTEVSRTIELNTIELDTSELVTCRDTRQLGTNVLILRCMTQADWERFRRMQEVQAQQFLRTLRGEH